MDGALGQDVDNAMAKCLAACNDGSRVCLQHIEHCLTLGGEYAAPAHITMLLTCSSVCRSASELMSLDSEWHPTMCDLCAQVCDECADACDALGDMEGCVAACRDCADACREMVGEHGEDDEGEDEEEREDELVASERTN